MFPYLDKIQRERQGKGSGKSQPPSAQPAGSGQGVPAWQWRGGPEVVRQESAPGASPQGGGQGWGVQPGLPSGFTVVPQQRAAKRQKERPSSGEPPAERSAAPRSRAVMAQPGDVLGAVSPACLQIKLT